MCASIESIETRCLLLTPLLPSFFCYCRTCPFGWPVAGIWPPSSDGTDINALDRSPQGTVLATGDDFAKVRLPARANCAYIPSCWHVIHSPTYKSDIVVLRSSCSDGRRQSRRARRTATTVSAKLEMWLIGRHCAPSDSAACSRVGAAQVTPHMSPIFDLLAMDGS